VASFDDERNGARRAGRWKSLTETKINHLIMNTKQNSIPANKIMDVRPIPCSVKHGQIIQRWLDLAVGDYFVLLNDHDPVPLYYQFSAEWPQAFSWEHLVKGPDEFRVKITKLKSPVAKAEAESACGCGQ
jgi:uncharacterized protein (DUF2249 family)